MLVGFVFWTHPIEGQIPAVDALLKKVKGVGIWAGPAWFTGSDDLEGSPAREVGIEGSISLASVNGWSFELDASYENFAGFEASNPSFDFHASIQALPGATLYVSPPLSFGPGAGSRVYFGINVGPMKLIDAKAFAPNDDEFSIKASGAQFGFSLGAVDLNSGFFIELAYRNRSFESLEFSGSDPVPGTWPRSLNANAILLRFGFQYFSDIGGGAGG
jgi:hypothetical protein